MSTQDLTALQKGLSHTFLNTQLLFEALCHRSYVNEQTDRNIKDNERLEFLGDAVLNLVISHLLMQQYPELNEGELSRARAKLVNERQLARLARQLKIGNFIRLGKGEIQTQGREKRSILADTFEALVAAIYIDGGISAVFKMVADQFATLLDNLPKPAATTDYKSRLQELVQTAHHQIPQYEIVEESGPDHDKTFRVQMSVCNVETEGEGKSKKMAEQEAARKALKLIQNESTLPKP